MPLDDEQTCGNYECKTCYPGGLIECNTVPETIRMKFMKSYEM